MADNAQDILKNVTVAELRTLNPGIYETILKGTTVQELQAHNPELVKNIIESNAVTEMKFTISGKEETIKVAEIQSKFDAYEDKITEMEQAQKQAELDAYKKQKISEMVDAKHVDTFMNRVSGSTHEEIDQSIESEIAFVREMGGMNNKPVGRNIEKLGDNDVKDAVRKMFGCKEEKK